MPTSGIPDDTEGFRRLYEANRASIHRLLARLARDGHAADDLLQETFLTVWRKRAQYRGEGSVEGWMKTIAVRTYLNARPRLVRALAETGLPMDPPARPGVASDDVGGRLDRNALLAQVRAAVDGLPAGWREPFVLFRYEGLTCAQVAELMGLSPKAVELRLARALRAVAERVRAVVPQARAAALDAFGPRVNLAEGGGVVSDRTDLDRLYDLAAGRLDDVERVALEERLASEPDLAAVWADLDAVLRAGEEPVPPCDVPFERLTLTDAPAPASWRRWLPLAAAAVVLLVAGVWTFSRDAIPARPQGPGGPTGPVRLEAIAMAAGDLPAAADGAFAGVGLPAAALGYAPAGPRGLRFIDGLAEGRQLAAASGRPLVVFLYEPSCPLCQELAATTFRDPGLAAVADPFVLARARASGEGAALLKAHAVGWPVFVLYGVDGEEVSTFGGAPDVATLREALLKVARPDLAPVPWPTVRATARALRVAEIARDAHERDDALERARTLAVDAPLAAAVAAATRAASAPAARALREARDLAASGALQAALARLDAALVVERGGRFERELAAVRARVVADGAFPALEEVR